MQWLHEGKADNVVACHLSAFTTSDIDHFCHYLIYNMDSQQERKDLASSLPKLTSMGGVWLDEIRKSNMTMAKDIVGGSATYGQYHRQSEEPC